MPLQLPACAWLNAVAPAYWRILVHGALVLSTVLWSLYAGKDLSWDSLNHHFYQGFSALNDRFDLDFAAAGYQAYFNPWAQVPFAMMVMAQWPPVLIGSVLAAAHASNLILAYEIALIALKNDRQEPTMGIQLAAVVAAVLGMLNPIFLQMAGSSFSDPLTGAIALAGIFVLVRTAADPRPYFTLLAGALLGAATALKMSNLVCVVAMGPALLMIRATWAGRARNIALYGGGVALGIMVAGLSWAMQLQENFGNPVLPLFNQVFASSALTSEPLSTQRFIPATIVDALTLPFRMLVPRWAVHTEPFSPDLRYATIAVLALALQIMHLRQRSTANSFFLRAITPASLLTPGSSFLHGKAVLLTSLVVAWPLWLISSGNSRYFLPMSHLAGVVIVVLVMQLMRQRVPAALLMLSGVATLQALLVGIGIDNRWEEAPWNKQWYSVQVPTRLEREPYLYLSLDLNSNSFLVPMLAPGSGMVSINGPIALSPDAPGGDRVGTLIDRNADRLRMLVQVTAGDARSAASLDRLDWLVARFALAIDREDCEFIDHDDGISQSGLAGSTDLPSDPRENSRKRFMSCRLISSPAAYERERVVRARADEVFNLIAEVCPALFQPSASVSLVTNDRWARNYVNTDAYIWTIGTNIFYRDLFRGDNPVKVGTIADWTPSRHPSHCPITPGPASAHNTAR